jgi:hypothetical protein
MNTSCKRKRSLSKKYTNFLFGGSMSRVEVAKCDLCGTQLTNEEAYFSMKTPIGDSKEVSSDVWVRYGLLIEIVHGCPASAGEQVYKDICPRCQKRFTQAIVDAFRPVSVDMDSIPTAWDNGKMDHDFFNP